MNRTMIALEYMQQEKRLMVFQKQVGLCTVIPNKMVVTEFAKLTNYLEGERFPQLQGHELKKEAYLRTLRKNN